MKKNVMEPKGKVQCEVGQVKGNYRTVERYREKTQKHVCVCSPGNMLTYVPNFVHLCLSLYLSVCMPSYLDCLCEYFRYFWQYVQTFLYLIEILFVLKHRKADGLIQG